MFPIVLNTLLAYMLLLRAGCSCHGGQHGVRSRAWRRWMRGSAAFAARRRAAEC